MKTPEWRDEVRSRMRSCKGLLTTQEVRDVIQEVSQKERGTSVKLRMTDGFIKTLADEGILTPVSKGCFRNNRSSEEVLTPDVAAYILHGWKRSESIILGGPALLSGEMPREGPLIMHTDASFSTGLAGLNGYDKDDPRGHCYVVSTTPRVLQGLEAFGWKDRRVNTNSSESIYGIASPEMALALMALQTSGQARLGFEGTVTVTGITDEQIEVKAIDPILGREYTGSIDPVRFSLGLEANGVDLSKDLNSIKRDSMLGKRLLALTSKGEMSIVEAIADHELRNDHDRGEVELSEYEEILSSVEAQERGQGGFGIYSEILEEEEPDVPKR